MKSLYNEPVKLIFACLFLFISCSPSFAQNNITDETTDTTEPENITAAPMPLTWGNVVAYRQDKIVKLFWTTVTEVNVKSFQVEKSLNGTDWSVAISDIRAFTLPGTSYYEQIDTNFNSKRTLYRVRQEGFDGRFSYSPIRVVSDISGADKIIVYPVPVDNNFHVGNINPAKVKSVQFISVNGIVLKTWNRYQSPYDIQGMAPGNYILRVETSDGTQVLRIRKQ